MPGISTEQVVARLKQGKPVPAILLLGPDAFLRESCREAIIDVVVEQGAREWAVQRYSAAEEDLETVLGFARMMPMLAPRQVIVFTELEAIKPPSDETKAEAKKDGSADLLREYIDSPAPFTVLIFEASELDKRLRFSKTLLEMALVVDAELPEDPRERLILASRMTKQMVAQEKGAIEDDASEELADMCNGDLAVVRSEVAKLVTYAGAGRKITRADVEALVVAEKKHVVWELAEVLAEGQISRALEFVDQLLREGEQPPALVGAMAWMFRKLLEAKDGGPGAFPGQAAMQQARKFSRARIVDSLRALYEADSRLKSGTKDHRVVLEFLVTQLAGNRERAAQRA